MPVEGSVTENDFFVEARSFRTNKQSSRRTATGNVDSEVAALDKNIGRAHREDQSLGAQVTIEKNKKNGAVAVRITLFEKKK